MTAGRRPLLTLVALVAIAACRNSTVPLEQEIELEELLPQVSATPQWSRSEGPAVHTAETLYEYVNGGAERYLGHGFREMIHVRYCLGDDALACVTLDLYDMGSDLGAFGFYAAGRPPGVDVRPWGVEGYRAGLVAAAWRGSLYVHGEADDDRPELVATLERLMFEVCERASGSRSQPAVLDPLPEEGRVAQSERYVPADLLGHAFLPGGVIATYEIRGAQSELYFSDLGSDAAAAAAFERLRAHMSHWGRVDSDLLGLGDAAFRYVDSAQDFGTAARADRYIAGMHGDLDPEPRERVLHRLLERLR